MSTQAQGHPTPNPGTQVPGGTGVGTRILIFAQVTVLLVLATALTGLVTWVLQRPALHVRWDLTEGDSASLDPATLDLLDKLPSKVSVEIFLDEPQHQHPKVAPIAAEAGGRFRGLLHLALHSAPTKLEVTEHDMRDIEKVRVIQSKFLPAGKAMPNVVILHREGGPSEVLELFKHIAVVRSVKVPGQAIPDMRMERYRGEEAFAKALKKVSQDERPRLLFSSGHGERDTFLDTSDQYSAFAKVASEDGFEVGRWDSERDPELPDDLDVLAIVDPRQPFTDAELEAIRRFLARGGRLFAATRVLGSLLEPNSLEEFLGEYGIGLQEGLVCSPFQGQSGPQQGVPECLVQLIGSSGLDQRHPITEPLWRSDYRVSFPVSLSFARAAVPAGATLQSLVWSPAESWRDRVIDASQGHGNLVFDPATEHRGTSKLMMVGEYPHTANLPAPPDAPLGRIVALACPDAFSNLALPTNRDLALNTLNWLADREFLVSVSPNDPIHRRMDTSGSAMLWIRRLSVFVIPSLFLFMGGLIWFRRRR